MNGGAQPSCGRVAPTSNTTMAQSLAELVTLLADEPTPANRDRFFMAFADSKVAIPLQEPIPRVGPGNSYTVGPNDRITIPETQGPDGGRWLLVYCDAAAMQTMTGRVWAEVAGRVILEAARANGIGIIVQNVISPSPTWSGTPKRTSGRFSLERTGEQTNESEHGPMHGNS